MKSEAWARIAAASVLILNGVLSMLGKNPLPFSELEVYEWVSALFAAASVIWLTWKNNSFTKEAKAADRVMAALKSSKVTVEQVEKLLNGVTDAQ